MSKVLQRFLDKVFHIPPVEQERALLMQVYIFLIIFTLLIVKPTANSLFLSKFGVESLPYAFILVAFLAALVALVYGRWLNRIPLNQLIKRTLFGCVASLLAFGGLLKAEIYTNATLYLFYLWVMIFALLTTSQFWVLANMVFNAREAKRLFGFIGAGAITGGIFGGYVTSFIATFTVSENLIFVAVGCLLPCIFLIDKIWDKRLPVSKNAMPTPKKRASKKSAFALILASKHLTYLAGIVGLSVMVAKLVDYQFSAIAAQHYPNKEALTAFFGFWFSTFNMVSLGLQLFLTRRIMENVGVSRTLYLMPIGILVAAVLLLVMPEILLIAIFLKLTEGSFKQSVNKAAMELLVLPIPANIKNPAKTFIDVFVDSLATGISGLLLIFMIKGLALPSYTVSLMIIGITGAWLYLVLKIRKEYLYAFKLKIESSITPTDVTQLNPQEIILPSKPTIRKFSKVLNSGSEEQILLVLKRIKNLKKPRLLKRTIDLLKHPSDKVRAAAILNADEYRIKPVLEKISPMMQDDSIKVQMRALEYLIKHDEANRLQTIEIYLEDETYQLRGVALVGLAALAKHRPELGKAYHLESRLFNWFSNLEQSSGEEEQIFRKVTFLKAIGRGQLDNYYGHIARALKAAHPRVVRQAILSAGKTQQLVFLNILVVFLQNKTYRRSAQEALVEFKEKAFPVFIEVMNNTNSDLAILRSLPKIIWRSKSPQALHLLSKLLLNKDLKVRHRALKGLNRLRYANQKHSFSETQMLDLIVEETQIYQHNLSLLYTQKANAQREKTSHLSLYEHRSKLIKLLEKRMDKNLERIFLLLGLKYKPEDMVSIYRSIRGRKAEVRINALEFLDNLLGMNLKKIIIPIIETAMLEQLTQQVIQRLKLQIISDEACLQQLIDLKDSEINTAVYQVLSNLKNDGYNQMKRLLTQEMSQVSKIVTSPQKVKAA